MENLNTQIVDAVVSGELEKLGVGKRKTKIAKPCPTHAPKLIDTELRKYVTHPAVKRRTTTGIVEYEGSYIRVKQAEPTRTATKSKHTPLEAQELKLGVRYAQLMRMMDGADFSMAAGKADAEISREKWSEFTQCITQFVGQAMEARGLYWRSGHEWSLERGELVNHIADFIKANGVYRDETGRNYVIKVNGE
jgi:hypothetical protein